MLEGVSIIGVVVVIVIGVQEIFILFGEDIAGAQVGTRESCFIRFFDFEHILNVVLEILTHLISEIGGGIPVTDDF